MEVDSYDASLEDNSNLEDDPSRDWDAWGNGSSRVSSKGSPVGNEVKGKRIILSHNHYKWTGFQPRLDKTWRGA